MARTWTDDQKKAIDARSGSILVSAAAGSGKTAVLVERVLRRITDEENPCPANRLLIVTFTKAAAGEMRDRLYSALKKAVRDDPSNSYLRQQEMLLADADICTMDSFCGSLVKENFRLLDISPDFRMIDQSELTVLEKEAIDTVMENEYRKADPAFSILTDKIFIKRDDSEIAECIIDLYRYSRAYAFPDEWLDGICESYDPNIPVAESCWGKAVIDYSVQAIEYCIKLNEDIYSEAVDGGDDIAKVFEKTYFTDKALLESILSALKEGKWDEARAAMGTRFATKSPAKNGLKDDPLVIELSGKRDTIKFTVSDSKNKSNLKTIFCVSESEYFEDATYFKPVVEKLVDCVKQFGNELMKLKKEKNSYDFPDIAHMALKLLTSRKNGKTEKTELAIELSKRYAEILIDEYQDTNEQQHILFSALSDENENLFRVGDVKQSIYSFRQAMPEIFISLRESLDDYNDGNYPAKICLGKNFRSRKGVTDFINYVFYQLMSKTVGGVDYNESEELVPGAEYPDTSEPEAEFHIIDSSSETNSLLETNVCQARYVASLIKDMISREIQVGREDDRHTIRYSDICILMRSVKSERATAYADEMRRWGIPCFITASGNFFSSSEIATMISILRVIDNPNQDIPLLSALMSPIFAFTPDETAQLRINSRKSSLYACLLKAESKNEKVAEFLRFFRKMRFIAATCTSSELIRRILDETSFLAIVQAMDSGELRRSNLMLLIDYAETYEKSGMLGLSGFIGFIDKLFINKKELESSSPVSENADVVRIMTIHKSKGLEFPVCILAATDKEFNDEDVKKPIIIDPENGVGLYRRDPITMAKYKTLQHTAAKIRYLTNMKSEEMRVLYVALTRAKEKLIVVTSVKNAEKELASAARDIDPMSKQIIPFAVLSNKSYSKWLLKAVIRHSDARQLREKAGADENIVQHTDGRLSVKLVDSVKAYTGATTTDFDSAEIDEGLQALIDERVNFKYKYASLATLATKRVASQLGDKLIDRENFATSKPQFLSDGKLSASQKGTATHKFMQYADFSLAEKDIELEAQRLVEIGKLTDEEAQSIRRDEVESFFKSDLYERIKRSNNVFREKKFSVNLPANEIYPEIEEKIDENVMIQGMIDCTFEENGSLVVVDYKTDRLTNEDDFKKEYSDQLKIYKYALEQIGELSVSQMCLYSFNLSKTIEIF